MAEFSDKIQDLMDEVYNEWRKDNNKGKWDVLGEFSVAHQIAVTFGNFDYQVENGGIEQWIYNGYFQDDAEKFTEYLEIGAETDVRCRNILDKVYQLDQYAHETNCDRYGNFYDPDDEDGEGGFIGEAINCDKFDSWYYEHCGKEDWWGIVCGIIDKAAVQELGLSTIKNITTDDLKVMTKREGLVLQGCGGDPAEWLSGVNKMLTETGILRNGAEFKDICVFEHNGLTNILFPFDDMTPDTLDMGTLAIWRLQTRDTFGGIWLSDYLPNQLGIDIDPGYEQPLRQPEKPSVLEQLRESKKATAQEPKPQKKTSEKSKPRDPEL